MSKLKFVYKRMKQLLPYVARFFWILLVVYNLLSFIVCVIAFALTQNNIYVSNIMEIAMMISIGICGLLENRKKV